MTAAFATKACVVCGKEFEPVSRRHKVCSEECAIALPAQLRREAASKQARRDLREYRRKERAAKGNSQGQGGRFMQAHIAMNDFVRERDYDKPCIVKGTNDPSVDYHGGHFIAVEACPALRFNLWNIHKQTASTNKGVHYRKKFRDTTGPRYEANLIKRIGAERVAWLKGPHADREFSDEYLARIASIFRRRAKLYRRLREARLSAIAR